jgi:hypothetical protein
MYHVKLLPWLGIPRWGGSIMINAELSQNCGECLTASELAEFLKLDRRTVVKYANRWGGVEVTPGTWRFFEKKYWRS